MINKYFFETVVVLLSSSMIFSLELKLVHFQQRMNRESLKLLNTLWSSSIQQCLPHRANFALPQKSMNPHQYHKGHAVAILHEMLQQIFNLFRTNLVLGSWEERHMEKFLIELYGQLEHLETALMGLEAEQKSGSLGTENLRLQVKMYFQRIHNYLENQKYSSCAWTIVRVEIIRCLFFVFRLTGKLSQYRMDP
ncbi:interferon epsilon [Loxodonta africana]|uniref:Interferon epsilon n=1 Tax=Loxodonta africana TaxID=9785 RepID=A0A7R8C3W4_LOXAF|nr:interferon epsilon [Loxodonta africana]CAB0000567.1 TPA: interferon 1EA [Loxodonta africana]